MENIKNSQTTNFFTKAECKKNRASQTNTCGRYPEFSTPVHSETQPPTVSEGITIQKFLLNGKLS